MKFAFSIVTALCAVGLLTGAGVHTELGRTYLCFGVYVLVDAWRLYIEATATKAVS